jgi:hypothetical protein
MIHPPFVGCSDVLQDYQLLDFMKSNISMTDEYSDVYLNSLQANNRIAPQ